MDPVTTHCASATKEAITYLIKLQVEQVTCEKLRVHLGPCTSENGHVWELMRATITLVS